MPFLLLFHEISRMTIVHWLGLATLVYATLSLFWFLNGLWGLMKLAAMASVIMSLFMALFLPGFRLCGRPRGL